MRRLLGVRIILVGVLTVSVAACGARATQPAGAPVFPFEPLPAEAPAYEGIGTANLKKLSLRTAIDVARAQALGALAEDIATAHVTRLSEIAGADIEPTSVSRLRTTVSRVFLPGQKFQDDLRVGDTLFLRIYMLKAEVDETVLPALRQITADLTPALRDAIAKDVQGSGTNIDDGLRILRQYQQRQRQRLQ